MGNLIHCRKHGLAFLADSIGCTKCNIEKEILNKIDVITGRFYGWRLSDQQDEDFSWLVNTLKDRLK